MNKTFLYEGNRRALLVVNPISGTRSKDGIEGEIRSKLAKGGITFDVVRTTAGGDAFRFASEAAEQGYGIVLVAGGDGTINEVASALRGTETPLGIIPLGSGNGLGRTLGIPQDVQRAAEIIAGGKVLDCDYGMVNDLPFFCTCGLGFDALVAARFAGMKRRGYISYLRSTLAEYLSYNPEPYGISIDGKVITEKALLVAVCNTSQYGNNVYIAPDATVTDGMLDITILHAGSPFSTALTGVGLLTGIVGKSRFVDTFRVKSATISRLSDGPVQIDGEPLSMGKVLDLNCVSSGLKIFVPGEPISFKPILTPAESFFNDLASNLRYVIGKRFGE